MQTFKIVYLVLLGVMALLWAVQFIPEAFAIIRTKKFRADKAFIRDGLSGLVIALYFLEKASIIRF